jgi:hypothetical protein
MRTATDPTNSAYLLIGIACSYVVDALLLAGFALSGSIGWWVPLSYLLVGLSECGAFYLWGRSPAAHGSGAARDRMVFVRMVVASAIQLGFIALAPRVGFYFLTVLFLVYGLGSMSVSERRAVWNWVAVALITGVLLTRSPHTDWIPQANSAERALVWLCFVTTLGRCIVLGIFGRP